MDTMLKLTGINILAHKNGDFPWKTRRWIIAGIATTEISGNRDVLQIQNLTKLKKLAVLQLVLITSQGKNIIS